MKPVNHDFYKEQMKKSFDMIVSRESNYTQEAKFHWISDNWLRKRFKLLWFDLSKTKVIHKWTVIVKCSHCWKNKEVEHNDLKDYRYWWMKKDMFCNQECHTQYMIGKPSPLPRSLIMRK